MEPLLILYILKNTVVILKGLLNVENLMQVYFCDFFENFPKHRKGNGI